MLWVLLVPGRISAGRVPGPLIDALLGVKCCGVALLGGSRAATLEVNLDPLVATFRPRRQVSRRLMVS